MSSIAMRLLCRVIARNADFARCAARRMSATRAAPMRCVVFVVATVVTLGLAGCANSDKASDNNNRFGGFYGGASGGAVP
jgi:hypothetical protein